MFPFLGYLTESRLKSDLRGIETAACDHAGFLTRVLKSDLRGIETRLRQVSFP